MTPRRILSPEARVALWRSLQTFTLTRIVIALVLLLYFGFDFENGALRITQQVAHICLAYAIMALVFSFAARRQRRFLVQLGVQVAIDLLVISLLYLAAGGMRSGLGILYLFPLAGAAILAPLLLALFAAAVATLFLLGLSVWQLVEGFDPPLMQAGLFGAAFFAAVLVVNRMAARLLGQEELAAQRGADLRIQQAINRNRDCRRGRRHPGGGRRWHGVYRQPGGAPHARAAGRHVRLPAARGARLSSRWPGPSMPGCAAPENDKAFVTVKPYREGDGAGDVRGRRDQPVHLKLRFARVAAPADAVGDAVGEAGGRSVIFMQDVSAIENQAQQLKLASMGRLTASIAHEVRNPLSAIGHADRAAGRRPARPGRSCAC